MIKMLFLPLSCTLQFISQQVLDLYNELGRIDPSEIRAVEKISHLTAEW